MIGLYFDARLSAAEERELRKELLRHPEGDPVVDEALAVMGYAASAAPPVAARRNMLRRIGVAAAVVAFLAVGAGILAGSIPGREAGECVAYVHGVRVDNEDEVMRLVREQLGEMGRASEEFSREVADDFGDISEIFKSESL